jgi:hypothetical protein
VLCAEIWGKIEEKIGIFFSFKNCLKQASKKAVRLKFLMNEIAYF